MGIIYNEAIWKEMTSFHLFLHGTNPGEGKETKHCFMGRDVLLYYWIIHHACLWDLSHAFDFSLSLWWLVQHSLTMKTLTDWMCPMILSSSLWRIAFHWTNNESGMGKSDVMLLKPVQLVVQLYFKRMCICQNGGRRKHFSF